ncbi:MAG TPA: hypothetical protein VGI73_16905 [Solirubrobacterales bacterium]|jgi:hypothetical protein
MFRATRRTAAICVAALALVVVAAPTAAVARGSVTISVKGTQKGTALSGKITGGTFGTGTYTGSVINGGTGAKITLKYAKGTLKLETAAKIKGRSISGSWKTTGGSGKFAHYSARGSLTGNLLAGTLTFTGKSS